MRKDMQSTQFSQHKDFADDDDNDDCDNEEDVKEEVPYALYNC